MTQPSSLRRRSGRHFAGLIALALITPVLAQTAAPASASKDDGTDQPVVLSEFVVSTPQSTDYGAAYASSATRLNVPLRDVPQSVTVITSQFIKDIGATDIIEAAAYAPGFAPRGPDPQSFVRGFLVNSIYKNLVLQPVPVHPDLAGVAEIEIIKGPASAIAGRGNAAGLLNYTMKKPVPGRTFGSLGLTIGSDAYKKVDFDFNTPVAPFGEHVTARIAGALVDSNHYSDPGKIERVALYPSFAWAITPKTDLLVELEMLDGQQPASTGHTYNTFTHEWTPFDVSISEDYARDKVTEYGLTATLVQRFNDVLSYRQIFNTASYDHDLKWVWADSLNVGDGTDPRFAAGEYYIGRHLYDQPDNVHGQVAQGDLLAKYNLAHDFVTNRTLISYDYDNSTATGGQTNYSMDPISLSNPIHGTAPYDPVFLYRRKLEQSTFSYLISHQSSFWHDRITVIIGWRKDRNNGARYTDLPTGVSTKNPASSVEHKRYGIVVKPIPELSLYYLYSDNNEPATTVLHFPTLPLTDSRQSWIPVATGGKMNEVGVKGDVLKGRVSFSLAYFDLKEFAGVYSTQFGPAQDDPATAGLLENVITPSDESKGWEFETTGVIYNRLTFLGSYYNTKTRRFINGAFRGFRGVPEETASLFLNYSFADRDGNGLSLRGGGRWQSAQWADVNNTFKFDAAYKIDVGVGYRHDRWTVQLNVNNVTNQVVPTQPNAFRYNTILPPREVRLSFTQTF